MQKLFETIFSLIIHTAIMYYSDITDAVPADIK